MRESESRSSISRAMRVACACMMGRKRKRAAVSSRAEPLQGLDEAGERGERRAQLVTRIGDEVGAHLLDPPQRREIVECHQHETGRARVPASAIGVTIASYQRSTGTRSKNSTRWELPLATARRIESRTSGTRSASETGSPRRSAGAIALARALRATTSPWRSSATTGSGSPASTASTSGSPTRSAGATSRGKVWRAVSPLAARIRTATAMIAKPASAGCGASVPLSQSTANTAAATINTKRARLSRSSHGRRRAPRPPSWIAVIRFAAPEIVAAPVAHARFRAPQRESARGS